MFGVKFRMAAIFVESAATIGGDTAVYWADIRRECR